MQRFFDILWRLLGIVIIGVAVLFIMAYRDGSGVFETIGGIIALIGIAMVLFSKQDLMEIFYELLTGQTPRSVTKKKKK